MSSDESDASSIDDEMSHDVISHDETIELLERNDPPVKQLDIDFNFFDNLDDLDDLDSDPFEVQITFRDARKNVSHGKIAESWYTLSDPAAWERLGRAIGGCSLIRKVEVRKVEGEIDQIDALNPEVYQCIGSLYRGLESNTSITRLKLDMDFFPSSGVFPTLNLNRAQFKEKLKHLTLSSEKPIQMNQRDMVLPLLESTSLGSFDICDCRFSTEAVYTRIISACTKVKRLDIKYMNRTECATALATLFRDRRSTLSQFNVYRNMSVENSNIILDGLAGNTTLKKLLMTNDDLETSKFERLLCNTSSIEGIHNSNHTLEDVTFSGLSISFLRHSPRFYSPLGRDLDVAPFVRECLELNKDTNKDKVIRTKIARYYFCGEFDIAPFVNMNVKLLPQVMAMIEGDAISRHDAIYRLLKSIPDLCTFSSGLSRKRKNNVL
eukprot:scaffold165819_cov36-Cyclotella_meneghiniana.AAC.2